MAKKKSNKEAVRERLSEKQAARRKRITVTLTALAVAVAAAALVFLIWNGINILRLKAPAANNGSEAQQQALDPAAMSGWWWTDDGNACFLLGRIATTRPTPRTTRA